MATYGTFRGVGWRFVGGLKQSSTNRGDIRISVKGMGWDSVYSKMRFIPKTINREIKKATKKNAEEVALLAMKYVPHGLETDSLQDSIRAAPAQEKGGTAMYTVAANTPYAHFVEMGVHPRGGHVLGRRQRAKGFVQQGPHFLGRAMADASQNSIKNIDAAVTKAIRTAIASAAKGFNKGTLDFNTQTSMQAARFVSSAAEAGVDITAVGGRQYESFLRQVDFDEWEF